MKIVNNGKYAAHTGGGNTGSIGVSMCAMSGFKSPSYVGDFSYYSYSI